MDTRNEPNSSLVTDLLIAFGLAGMSLVIRWSTFRIAGMAAVCAWILLRDQLKTGTEERSR